MIEHYLGELERELAATGLRGSSARRVLLEVRDHLLELAAENGEEEAVARIGPAQLVAARVAAVGESKVLVRSTLVFLGALVLFVLPLYAIPENTLPSAPWVERPAYLTWKLQASLAAFGVAGVLAVVAAVAAWRHWTRLSLTALAASGIALGTCGVLGAVLAVQWAQAVPGSGATLVLTLIATTALGGIAAAALASAQRVRRLPRDLPS